MFIPIALDEQDGITTEKFDSEIRNQFVALNVDAAESVFSKSNPAESIRLQLFAGEEVVIQRSGFDTRLGGGAIAWSGKVSGFEDGFATLVYRRGGIIGHVQYGTETYRISPGESGLHKVTELDISNFSVGEDAIPISEDSIEEIDEKQNSEIPSIQTWQQRVEIFYMYTEEARLQSLAARTTIRDEALLSLAMLNMTMDNTALRGYKFKFAGIRGLSCGFVEGGRTHEQMIIEIGDLTGCVGQRAAQKRDEAGADLIAVLKSAGDENLCGVAFLSGGGSDKGISLTNRGGCISAHILTHEVGHNFGINHDRYMYGYNPPSYAFNFGYTLPHANTPIRSVMAYNDECSSQGVFCRTVPVFSNTHKLGQWNGYTMGRGLHHRHPALGRKMIINKWDIVANFR